MSTIDSIRQKRLQDLDVQDLMTIHLSNVRIIETQDFAVHSCLHTLEENMMHSISNDHIYPYCNLLCAFAILDQIGSTYEPITKTSVATAQNGIKKALHYFSGYQESSRETKALVAFRNGIMHDGSFTNFSRHEKKHYIFRLKKDQADVINVAAEEWDGSGSSLRPEVFSYINRDQFHRLTLDVLLSVKNMLSSNNLKANIRSEDFLHKFILWDAKENIRSNQKLAL